MADAVEIAPYDPHWPALFAEEAARLRQALPADLILGLEHFGSTAVPGLAAKPIIDILIAVRSLAEAQERTIEPLEALDYAFWYDNPKTDRMYFVKGMPPYGARRTHHVYLTETNGEMWGRLAFRDHLRTHPEDARRYERLKRELAVTHRDDREAYTDAKAAFVAEIMAKAG